MSKMGNYILGIEEDVYAIKGLEEKISESEDITEVKTFVVETLGLKTSFDIGIAEDAVASLWNENWSYYI